MGVGNYWRNCCEYLLLGVHGDLPFRVNTYPDVFNAPRTRHSAKPEAIRRIIEDVSPGPRLELFGRRVATGWTVFGNEIERTMFDYDVMEVA
jgi:N6-adenosine-specific RNA methylase IME4